jgi:hypothetical protein
MRRVGAWKLVSVDGVMERPEEWAFSYSDDEMGKASAAGMAASDALLLGRETYEHLAAYWPNQPGGTPMVDFLNGVPKYVVSTTLDEAAWSNAVLHTGAIGPVYADEAHHAIALAGDELTGTVDVVCFGVLGERHEGARRRSRAARLVGRGRGCGRWLPNHLRRTL